MIMKVLGIDFGTKRIGLAISDDEGSFAFPLKTIENSPEVLDEIEQIVKEYSVERIVLGEPGSDEHVQETKQYILVFKNKLEERGWEVFLQDEQMTSFHSDIFGKKKPIARKWGSERKDKKDESAAALILQRYLDIQSFKK